MKLSIIIVSWNVCEKLKKNLEKLVKSQVNFDFEIFVVDNNSADDTVAMVRDNFPEVKLIANDANQGFAKANNIAMKLAAADGRYILLLNPDMQVQADTLQNAIDWLDKNSQASLAGFRLTTEQGVNLPHVRRFPGLFDQLAIVLKIPHLFPNILNGYLCSDFNYDKPSRVDSVRGSFFMIRRLGNELPLLDERYFIWFEEVDYCRQLQAKGLEVWYSPAATAIDYVGGSFSQVKRGLTQSYFRDSMLAYFKKWHSWPALAILKLAWPIGSTLARLGELAKIKSKSKT